MNEIQPIPEYPQYYASSTGDIYHFKNGEMKKLHPYYNKDYFAVKLYNDIVPVARIIALIFLPSDHPINARVYHFDGDPGNNAASNLVWATPFEISKLSFIDISLRRSALIEIRKENDNELKQFNEDE